jgi:hypothetical protein
MFEGPGRCSAENRKQKCLYSFTVYQQLKQNMTEVILRRLFVLVI